MVIICVVGDLLNQVEDSPAWGELDAERPSRAMGRLGRDDRDAAGRRTRCLLGMPSALRCTGIGSIYSRPIQQGV